MDLLTFCRQITGKTQRQLEPNHRLGSRLVCPEYSKSTQEVKTYPLLSQERVFALCWNFGADRTLYSTMCPAPSPFCYPFPFTPGEKTQLHTHAYLELAYVVQGEFRQKILGRDITFRQGELCLIDKNCLHQDYLLDQPAVILFFGISGDMFSEIMDETITTRKIISFLQSALLEQKDLQQYLHFKPGPGAAGELEDCLYLLLRELYECSIGTHYMRKGLMLRMFRILSTQYEFSLSREQRRTMNWVIFEEITDYIKNHSSTVSIRELTRIFHYQDDYFNRLIHSKTGLTYSAYVRQIRLSKAEHLLLHTTKTIDEIMELTGYHNKGYFYKIFQEKYGMTPSRYRKEQSMQNFPAVLGQKKNYPLG